MSYPLKFDRVKNIPNKWRNLKSGYIRKMKVINMPDSIKLVVLLFYYHRIESSILSIEETDKLQTLFNEKNKFKELGNYSYKLIYRRSVDGWQEKTFKDKCHDRINVLCIILDAKGNVFGGYTAKGWQGRPEYESGQDDKAFLFSIRSSYGHPAGVYDAIKGKYTICLKANFYCIFGVEGAIWIYENAKNLGGCRAIGTFERPPKSRYLNGDSDQFNPKEIEVFHLINE